jgi:hypothetical protein
MALVMEILWRLGSPSNCHIQRSGSKGALALTGLAAIVSTPFSFSQPASKCPLERTLWRHNLVPTRRLAIRMLKLHEV